MTKKKNPLVEKLNEARPTGNGGNQSKIDFLFGGDEDVLTAIREARQERKLSYSQIAKVLSSNGTPVGEGAVKTWFDRQGIQ